MPFEFARLAVVAEGLAGSWPWRLEAWRTAEDERPVLYRVSGGGRESSAAVTLGDLAVNATFAQDEQSSASVLFGPVSDEVETIVVEPVYPASGPPQHHTIRSAKGLGRFFVAAFEQPVELAKVRLEPAQRFSAPETFVLNMGLEARRQDAEAVELGTGTTPEGPRWRLRLWRERPELPELLRVDLIVTSSVRVADPLDKRALHGAGGYGGPPMPAEQVISWRMIGRSSKPTNLIGGSRESHQIIGELVPAVARVQLVLNDGAELQAEIVRTGEVENDYFVAFPERQIVEVNGLDEHNRLLGRQTVQSDIGEQA